MSRPTLDETVFQVARTWARRSTCSRLQVGAVLARDGRVLSTGYNGAPSRVDHCAHMDDQPCEITVHAEANALIFAGRHGVSTEQASLYTTCSPCRACAGLIINAGIREVIYADPFRSASGLQTLADAGLIVRRHEP